MDWRPLGWNYIPFLARALGLALSLIAFGAEVRADEVDCVIKELQARSGRTNSPSTVKERREVALRLQSQLKAFGVSSEIKSDPEHAGHYLLTLSAPRTQLSKNWFDNVHDRNPLVAYVQRAQALGVTPVYSTFRLLDDFKFNGYFKPENSEVFLGLKILKKAELRPTRLRREIPFLDLDIAEHESIHMESDIQGKLLSLLKDVWRDPLKAPKKIRVETNLLKEISSPRSEEMPPPGDYIVVRVSPPNVFVRSLKDDKYYTLEVAEISKIVSVEVKSFDQDTFWLRKPGMLYGPDLEFFTYKIPDYLKIKEIPAQYKSFHASSEVEANLGNIKLIEAARHEALHFYRRHYEPLGGSSNSSSKQGNHRGSLSLDLESRKKKALSFAMFQAFHIRAILEAGPSAVTVEVAGHERARLVYDFPGKQMEGEVEIPLESSHGADSESMKREAFTILSRRLRALEDLLLESIPIAPPAVIDADLIEPKVDAPKPLPLPPQRPMPPPGKSK